MSGKAHMGTVGTKRAFLLAMLLYLPLWAQTVVIDPGHGGSDRGAVAVTQVNEKDINLAIAIRVRELNASVFSDGVRIELTRQGDVHVPLSERSGAAIAKRADLFISVHCNQSPGSGAAQGIEVYVAPPGDTAREHNIKRAIYLSTLVGGSLEKGLGFKSRGVKFGDFQVLRETIAHMPSILIELGFLSNAEEAQYFNGSTNIDAVAVAILDSIYGYYGSI